MHKSNFIIGRIYTMNNFKKIFCFLVAFTTLSVQGKVISPAEPVAPTEPAPEQVHGVMATTGLDGSPLPDINGKLSLQDCIDLALANSPSAVSASLQKKMAKVELNLAKGNFLPTAEVTAGETYTTHKTAGSSTVEDHYGNISADATLSLRGITDLARNVKMKQVEVEQAELKFEGVKNDIIRTVKKNYYSLLSAIKTVDIRTQSRDVYKEQYDRTNEYYRLGLRPKVDVTTAEVNLNNEELRLIRAKNTVKTASAMLANALGITTSKTLDIQDDASWGTMDLSFDEVIKTAYENRPDVDSARLDMKLGKMRLNQAKFAYLPTLSFLAGFSKSGDDFHLDNEDARLAVGIEIPIFNAFKTYNGVKQAQLNLESTQNNTRSLLNNVFLEVQNAYIKMEEAKESIPIAELNAEKAKENLELSQGRYNEGIGDIIELKDAEAAYTDAELSLLTARYDYASAVADLKQAMGTY